MEKWKKRAFELITGLAFTGKADPSVITPYPQKTRIMRPEPKLLKRPILKKSFGVSPKRLTSLITALEEERRANVHSITVVKENLLLLDASHPGYSSDMPHLSHSMSKTLTGLAIGILWDEGRIDLETPVLAYFPEVVPSDKRFHSITIHHLLSMTAGVSFGEAGVVSEENWIDGFFSSSISFNPGEGFLYNSMNSFILAVIATRILHKSLDDFIADRILRPLGIKSFFWEKSREGFVKGGFGVYMSCEAWARVGVMLLNRGSYGENRIVSEDWIKLATEVHGVPPLEMGAFNYGYHIWCGRENDEMLISGMLGQNVWVSPKNRLVVSINSGNNELFQESPALTIIRAYLGTDLSADPPAEYRGILELRLREAGFFKKRHWIRPKKKQRGISYAIGLKSATPFDESFTPILGEYAFPENNHQGILPLFVALMQSSFLGGIEKIAIERRGEKLFFRFTEGGVAYEFEAGFYEFKSTELTFGNERYLLRAMAEAIEDEDRRPIYKLELVFPELPNSKMIKLHMDTGRLVVRISETPNQKIAESYIGKIATSPTLSFAIGILEKKLGEGYIERKLVSVFNPMLLGISTSRIGYQTVIEDESKIARETRASSTKLLTAFMNKFISDEPEPQVAPEKKEGGIFKRAILSIFSKRGKREEAATVPTQSDNEVSSFDAIEELKSQSLDEEEVNSFAIPNGEAAISDENAAGAVSNIDEAVKEASEPDVKSEEQILANDALTDAITPVADLFTAQSPQESQTYAVIPDDSSASMSDTDATEGHDIYADSITIPSQSSEVSSSDEEYISEPISDESSEVSDEKNQSITEDGN